MGVDVCLWRERDAGRLVLNRTERRRFIVFRRGWSEERVSRVCGGCVGVGACRLVG